MVSLLCKIGKQKKRLAEGNSETSGATPQWKVQRVFLWIKKTM